MQVLENHWLDFVEFVRSPNFDSRPSSAVLSLVVIHCISLPRGVYGSKLVHDLFTNAIDFNQHRDLAELQDVRVSAHLLIERDGHVTQFVPFNERAWHAGESAWQNRSNCNDYSIGIELEGTDDSAFEDAQYATLVAVLAALLQKYPTLSIGNIVGHQEIAPARKTDPGSGFDWARVYAALRSKLRSLAIS